MPLLPRLPPVHCQRLQVGPADRPAHHPLVRLRARLPKHLHKGATGRPLLHRRGAVVRRSGRRMQIANICAECGQHPSQPPKWELRWSCNPSPRGRRPRGRLRVFGRSRQIRTWERHLPRPVAFPARDRPQPTCPQSPRNRLDRESLQKPHQHVLSTAVRRKCGCRPRQGRARGTGRSGGRVGRPVCTCRFQRRTRFASRGHGLQVSRPQRPRTMPAHADPSPMSDERAGQRYPVMSSCMACRGLWCPYFSCP
jgi:hypothetical protein